MARPKTDQGDQLRERLTLRLRPHERALLAARAAEAGLSVSIFARRALLGAEPAAVQDAVGNGLEVLARCDPALVLALNRIGANMNQIARALNTGFGLDAAGLNETLARLNALLDGVHS